MQDNENTEAQEIEVQEAEQIKIKCPPALTNEEFRNFLIEETKSQIPNIVETIAENAELDISKDAEKIDAIIYEEGLRGLFDDIAEARLDEDNEKLLDVILFCGFYNEEDRQAIETLKQYNQTDSLTNMAFQRISQVDDMQTAVDFLTNVNTCDTCTTPLQLDNAFEKIEDFTDFLSGSNRSKIFLNMANNYRRVSPKDTCYAEGQELNFLKHALFYADDYKVISACDTRLNPRSPEKKLVSIAYKKALRQTENPKILFKLHSKLGDIYQGRSKVIGYTSAHSEKEDNLEKAIHHYSMAAEYSFNPDDRILTLRNLANVQFTADRIDDWAMTKYTIAMSIEGYDRYSMLVGTAEKIGKKGQFLLETALKDVKKDNLTPMEKINIQERAYTQMLRIVDEPEKAKINKRLAALAKQKFDIVRTSSAKNFEK
ncbi:MAG: hypothetical protein IJZ59_07045 [Alphaproteobacteria bacterium]|nr:hypothetical protein [Alphaproteobacteria bacterium]